MSRLGDNETLRATLQILHEAGLLDRLESVTSAGVTFHPLVPTPEPVSAHEREVREEKAREANSLAEYRRTYGAAGGIRPKDRVG